MAVDEPGSSDPKPKSDDSRPDDETLPTPTPKSAPSPFESALAQYADSIERLRAETGVEMDPYTRGFVAGLRAAIKFASNEIKS